jgi:predicted ATPase
MKITDFRAEPVNEIIYLKLNSSSSRKTRVNIADVGFGVSQIFPILLEGLRMPRGSTLLLEQPEIHLHPNLQMQMADYFISLALSGKRVIVETHSDHIINRLVRRIVEDVNLNLKDQIAIYFIRPNVDGAVFEEIKIDDKRGIINWPEDFFDQTALEQEKILQAGLKKRQAARAREGKK